MYAAVLALAIRVILVFVSPRATYFNTDLEIYRLGGQLVRAGINPYDPRDGVALRATLRAQTISPTLRTTQANWDYEVSTNLPFNLLYFGAIDWLWDDALCYRIVFAVVDSVLAALVMAFVLRHWPQAPRMEAAAAGLALGACSLVMLQWGVHSPQDKGAELLLMVAGLLCLFSSRRSLSLYGSAVFIGLSVAFKGIGICLFPLGCYVIFRRGEHRWRNVIVFALIALVTASAWHLRYVPGVITMMADRVGEDTTIATHASPFTWITTEADYRTHVDSAKALLQVVRVGTLAAFLAPLALALLRRRISAETATAVLLVVFTCVFFVGGSLDRMNIAILSAILLIGTGHPNVRRAAVLWYTLLGVVSVVYGFRLSGREEHLEALMVGIGLLLMTAWLWWIALGSRRAALAVATAFMTACAPKPGASQSSPLSAQLNPFLGGWFLVASRSRFDAAPLPDRQVFVCDARRDGSMVLTEFAADGRTPKGTFEFRLDGMERRVGLANPLGIGAISLTRVNEYIVDFVARDGPAGSVRATGTLTASRGSNFITVDVRVGDGRSNAREQRLVYEKY